MREDAATSRLLRATIPTDSFDPHIACVDTTARRRFVNQRWLRMCIGARNIRRCEFNVMRFTDRRLAKCPHGTCDFRARRNPFQANPFEAGAYLQRRLSIRWKPQSRFTCLVFSAQAFSSSYIQEFMNLGVQKFRASVFLEGRTAELKTPRNYGAP